MSDATQPVAPPAGDDALAARAPLDEVEWSDERNPAIIDARKTFVIIVVSAALFVGAIVIFIL